MPENKGLAQPAFPLALSSIYKEALMQRKTAAKSRRGAPVPRASRPSPDDYLVLRTVYMPPKLDNKLRLIAEKRRTSKNEVIRGILADAVGV